MNKKMVFGVLVTLIGLVYSSICFVYAALNPWDYNGIDGLLGSLLGTKMLIPFIISLIVMIFGLGYCFWCANKKEK